MHIKTVAQKEKNAHRTEATIHFCEEDIKSQQAPGVDATC